MFGKYYLISFYTFLFFKSLFCLDLQLNNEPVAGTVSFDKVNPDLPTYPIPIGDEIYDGIALHDLIPPLLEAYQLDIYTESQKISFQNDDLAELFTSVYLVNNFRDLYWQQKWYRNIIRLNINGIPVIDPQLEIWISWEGTRQLKNEIKLYTDRFGIKAKVTEVPKISSKLIAVDRAGGHIPDLIMVQSDYLPQLTDFNVLQNLDYLKTLPLVDSGRQAFLLAKKIWAIPFYFDAQLFFLNNNIIEQLPELDWTLGDLTDLCRSLKQQGYLPLSLNAYSAYWLLPFQFGFGKENLFEKDGSLIIHDNPTRQALTYLLEQEKNGLFKSQERSAMMSFFLKNKTAMMLSGSYSIPQLKKLGMNFSVLPFPYNEKTKKHLSPLLDFKGLAIPKKTHNPVLARRMVQYLTGYGSVSRFIRPLYKLPANDLAWKTLGNLGPDDHDDQDHHVYKVLSYSREIGTVVPSDRSYTIFKNTMWKLLHFIFEGKMSIAETLNHGQNIITNKMQLIK